MQLLIYTTGISSRLTYVCSTLLQTLRIESYLVTSDLILYNKSSGAKINYSAQRINESEIWIESSSLLFETGIRQQQIACFDYKNQKAFFATSGDIPFDIFAASFFLLSRYEEYLPHQKDVYGRYSHENSVAFREGFLQLPVINLWVKELSILLSAKWPALTLNTSKFAFLPTYDIDIAYSYRSKGLMRNMGGFLRSILSGEWSPVVERMNVLFNKTKDPFDSYEWLHQLHRTYRLKPLYFFLFAGKNKAFDKNILPGKKALRKLVEQHSNQYELGIHPSWQSADSPELLKSELANLQRVSGKSITKSRHHYIRTELPKSYRALIEAGILEDYSMGYGSINGFRSSYCLPHFWYDLQNEQTTALRIFPFCFMDANSYYEQRYNSDEALNEIKHYVRVTKQVQGLLITIWHNHLLGNDKMFYGWKEVYEAAVKDITGNTWDESPGNTGNENTFMD